MLNSSLLTFESVNWLYTLNDLFCLSSERIFCLWLKRGQSLRKWAYTYPPLCIYTFFLVKSSWVFFVCLRVFGVGFLFGWFFYVPIHRKILSVWSESSLLNSVWRWSTIKRERPNTLPKKPQEMGKSVHQRLRKTKQCLQCSTWTCNMRQQEIGTWST